MKLINPSVELITQAPGLEGIYKQVERVGRVCYKSEDKITENSAKPFVDRMIKSGHGAMLEHGTVYLEFHVKDPSEVGEEEYHSQQSELNKLISKYANNKYSIIKVNHYYDTVFITTNYRVLIENNWLKDLKYICEPTEFHERRVTVHFVCDRGVSHEFVRHRVMSFAQESTRYCNYSKDKFDNELTFIIPVWVNTNCPNKEQEGPSVASMVWSTAMLNAESSYKVLLEMGWTPQQARAVLQNSLKTELVVTGFTSDWKNFFDLRYRGTTGLPHPDAKQVASMAHDLILKELGKDL